MRKNILISIIAVFLTTFLLSSNTLGQKVERIRFKRGARQALISGHLNGYKDKKVFVLRVRNGQTLNTEQIKSEASLHYITVSITSPSGEDVTDLDISCNNRKEVTPTEAGDYTITVFECQKADAWKGTFKLKVKIE